MIRNWKDFKSFIKYFGIHQFFKTIMERVLVSDFFNPEGYSERRRRGYLTTILYIQV
jgi:hypothetical protein